ncbi:MAG: NAD-glutamate dehydrogenase domain-containing protein [Neisseriaceae bacterium]
MSTSSNNAVFEKVKLDLSVKLDKTSFDNMCKKYENVFPDDYLNSYIPTEIANDMIMIDGLSEDKPYAIELNKGINREPNVWQIKLFKFNSPVSLSKALPIVENFGVQLLDEHLRKINLSNGNTIYVCDFGIQVDDNCIDQLGNEIIRNNLKYAMIEVFNDIVENDILNKLILRAGLNAHQVTMLRSIAHYIAQGALPFSKETLKECLTEYPKIANNLFLMFEAKFGLHNKIIEPAETFKNNIIRELLEVNNINDDRALRAHLSVIEAMVRTNYYQPDNNGMIKSYISFKLESGQLSFLPKPKPLYEIFVYSKRVEGVHLRGGKIARGGIRWSDRKDDYRTEVLGLVKAQIVKNSVIVPTGSKGGFICKLLPPATDRDAYLAEGVACYKIFISGLLDITDNMISGKVIAPKNVIKHDEDDPYLVVAADKGTATFSDYANSLSLERGFWLGDAFASGGSAGYDHKKIGITARGAWESAKRHFRHLGKDIQNEEFTVVGIGDMAGDVFGNGMLLSKYIKLVAAFNHQHIFLDPTPDCLTSYEERKRLFDLPRSSWSDYDPKKISKGGGIFEHSLKVIPLSTEIKELLKVESDTLSPNELINTLLKLNVDMIYNGGIGTYIKSSTESHETVKDKANDALRVDGMELRAKVVIEGGNLGATQLGRVEFAKNGGSIFTDAIDNSAGVDCSDHEVNIKILFADIMHKTDMGIEGRNKILELMTDDVSKLVLKDNYLQTQILYYANYRANELFTVDMNFIDKFEKLGYIDRAVEFLPNTHEVNERLRIGTGLTMPELAVLLAYSKIKLNQEILKSSLTHDEIFDELLINYFPKYLQENYKNFIMNHYLKKDITANQLSNLIVNIMGITFISRFEDEFRIDVSKIIHAFWSAYKLLDIENILVRIESLDNKVDANIQVQMLIRVKKSLERLTRWILRNIKTISAIKQLVPNYKDSVLTLLKELPKILNAENYPETKKLDTLFISHNVPEDLAKIVARSSSYPQLIDIAILAKENDHDLVSVANNYFYAGRVLRLDWLRQNLILLPENNKWQALSRSALLADGYKLYSILVRKAIKYAASKNDPKFLSTWINKEQDNVEQINIMFDELQTYKTLDLAMLSAVVRELSVIFAK